MIKQSSKDGSVVPIRQRIALWLMELVVQLLLLIPHQLRIKLFAHVIKFLCLLKPKYFKIADTNLKIAFPNSTAEWRRSTYNSSLENLGLIISDFLRIPTLSKEWLDKHIDASSFKQIDEFRANNPGRGIIIVAGHIGSFELQGLCFGFKEKPLTIVVRKIRPKWLDIWWNTRRELSGNGTMNREGAFKRALKMLTKGGMVAFLADQNVTRNHAVFVPWFGKLAATTKAVALLGLRTNARIFVSYFNKVGQDSYKLDLLPVDIEDLILKNDSSDQILSEVTQRFVKIFEEIIIKNPESWFWIHRRWKTTPTPEEPEDLYN